MSTALEITENPIMVDKQAENHLQQVAQSTTKLTGIDTGIKDIQPVQEQHPLDEALQSELKQVETAPELKADQSEFEDIMQGLQGRPRTTGAIDILKEKMSYMAKKTGSQVELVDKKK